MSALLRGAKETGTEREEDEENWHRRQLGGSVGFSKWALFNRKSAWWLRRSRLAHGYATVI